jgi:hypothetical protein
MRPAGLHELALPSQYALWYRYTNNTALQTRIGPIAFTNLLNQRGAIELLNLKGYTVCKTLNKNQIHETLLDLYSQPFYSESLYFSHFWQATKQRLKLRHSISSCFKRLRSSLRTIVRSIRVRATGRSHRTSSKRS